MTKEKSTMIDRMNYTDAIETGDLMTKQERAEFEKMSPQEQDKFMQEVIIPRSIANQE
jgi:hypothetical protein